MTSRETLERYFEALRRHDWEELRDCVAHDVVRTGPYADVVRGREAYATFLADVVPRLQNYELRIHDVARGLEGEAWVRLSELLDVDGERREHPEALRFGFAADGRISDVDIYLKRPARRDSGTP